MLVTALKIPVLGLVDSDPYGLKILSVYASGSKVRARVGTCVCVLACSGRALALAPLPAQYTRAPHARLCLPPSFAPSPSTEHELRLGLPDDARH